MVWEESVQRDAQRRWSGEFRALRCRERVREYRTRRPAKFRYPHTHKLTYSHTSHFVNRDRIASPRPLRTSALQRMQPVPLSDTPRAAPRNCGISTFSAAHVDNRQADGQITANSSCNAVGPGESGENPERTRRCERERTPNETTVRTGHASRVRAGADGKDREVGLSPRVRRPCHTKSLRVRGFRPA